jgi:hypothetical protein
MYVDPAVLLDELVVLDDEEDDGEVLLDVVLEAVPIRALVRT